MGKRWRMGWGWGKVWFSRGYRGYVYGVGVGYLCFFLNFRLVVGFVFDVSYEFLVRF